MEQFELTTTVRPDAGKGVARRLRAAGRLPAVLYGLKTEPMGLDIPEPDMRRILRRHPESPVVRLHVEGQGGPVDTIVRDVQRHPATGRLLHVDFQRIRLDEKVRVDVPVELRGEPVGVKEQGGVLEHVVRVVSVMCLPREIPQSIGVDISALGIGDVVRVADLAEGNPNLDFTEDPDTMVATVLAPTVSREAAATEAGEAAGEAPGAGEGPAAGESS